jgi:WD40 repeat protein
MRMCILYKPSHLFVRTKRRRPFFVSRALVLGVVFSFLACTGIRAQNDLISSKLVTAFNVGKSAESVALSPDGKWGAVGTADGGVGVFSLEAPGSPRWVAHHKKRVEVLAFDHAGSVLASAGEDGVIDLVNVSSGASRSFVGHHHKVWALAFSPDDQLLASGGDDKEIIAWDLVSGKESYRLTRGGTKSLIYLGFNGGGTGLMAVDTSGELSEWDVKTRARLRQLKEPDSELHNATGNLSGQYLAVQTEFVAIPGAGNFNGNSPGATQNSSQTSQGSTGPARAELPNTYDIHGEPRGSDVYHERRIKLYDTEKFEVAKTIDGVKGEITSISLSADNAYVSMGLFVRQRMQSFLSVFDVSHGNEVISQPSKANVMSVSFSEDGKWLASGADDGEVRLYQMKGIFSGGGRSPEGVKFSVTCSQANALIPADSHLVLGVMNLDANGVDPGTPRAIAEMLQTRIGAGSSVTMVERVKIDQIIKEQTLQLSNLSAPDAAAKIGQLLGARKMIFGSVSELGTLMTIHTSMIDTSTAKIDSSCEVICRKCALEDLPDAVSRLMPHLVEESGKKGEKGTQ